MYTRKALNVFFFGEGADGVQKAVKQLLMASDPFGFTVPRWTGDAEVPRYTMLHCLLRFTVEP